MSEEARSKSVAPSALKPNIQPLSQSEVTFHILSTSFFTFLCYLSIGLPLAVLPGYVHVDLGYSSVMAGLAISVQYLATMLSRPRAGRIADSVGPKTSVLYGLMGCAASGAILIIAALFSAIPWLSLVILMLSRLVLGYAESLVGTGAITWGIGRVGAEHTARMISWNGIATYGALAVGAPLGVVIVHAWGLPWVGVAVVALGVIGYYLARRKPATAVIKGEHLPFRHVLRRVLPHGLGLALGSVGFGSIATFITLFYASHHWPNAAFALTLFGGFFVGARLLFASMIGRFGGFRVAVACFAVEALGLLLLGFSTASWVALSGAALTGFGFALVFPALGVEAVRTVPQHNRGSALGAYSLFLDLALGITGPLAGLIATAFGYPEVFLFAAMASLAGVALTVVLHRRSEQAMGNMSID
ncbi:MFS transporter [Glaciimonas sp. PCH181]|uniref:MFS transporter n=1 Tax=Glaciimonas sp. PCH181 TaxID=2133943 RepID=UPI000D33B02B|nr:MFS transporter [Glaciimonas sp. PCH181]PUA20598.1 MFS transporter [Glaciimonas sp. PCH181]